MKRFFKKLVDWLRSLSFRAGVVVLLICGVFYALSFAQMLLPISLAAKSVLWVVLFGAAKASQYTALLILGKAGLQRVKALMRSGKSA